MGRKRVACLLLSVSAAAVVLAGGATVSLRTQSPESLEQLVYMPQVPLRMRLGSGALDPKTGEHVTPLEHVVEISSPHAHYVKNWDGSTEDVTLASNSDDLISSQSYYPLQPGEAVRRPHVTRVFGASNAVVNERVLSLAGMLSQTTATHADGSKVVIDFASDGKTHLREQVFSPPECCDGAVLLRDARWRDDATHSLAYLDTFNDDKTRTITEFDEHERVLKVVQWTQNHSTYGTTVKAFYPGSLKLRLDSKTDYSHNEARYYREDGTLEALVEISSTYLEIHYYDSSGTKERLFQEFFIQGGYKLVTDDDAVYKLYVVTEFDDDGNKTQSYTYRDGAVSIAEKYNVTVGGTRFVQLDFDYKDGSLATKRYWLNEVKFPPFKVEEHTPAEHLPPDQVDATALQLQMHIDAGLPRPYPQGGH